MENRSTTILNKIENQSINERQDLQNMERYSSMPLKYLSFNQDNTTLSVVTRNGFKIITMISPDKIEVLYEYIGEPVVLVERLFSSLLLAIVTRKLPRRLKICHFKKETEICNYSYPTSIIAIRMNRLRLVVCLESSLHIHNIRDMVILHTIKDTAPNIKGVFALSNDVDQSIIAYPSNAVSGTLQLFDATNLRASIVIAAHESAIAAICFNFSNTLITTASIKGTIIRVFSVDLGTRVYEFRRGMKRCVDILDLRFCTESDFICTTSNTETIHVFKKEDGEKSENPPILDNTPSWGDYLGSALKSSASILPGNFTEMFNQTRAFAVAYLPSCNLSSNCAIIEHLSGETKLYSATLEGFLYVYDIDLKNGGECTLYKQFKLDESIDDRNYDNSLPIDQPIDIGLSEIKSKNESIVKYKDPIFSTPKPLIDPILPEDEITQDENNKKQSSFNLTDEIEDLV